MAQRKPKRLRLNDLDFWEALSRSKAYRRDFLFRFGKPFSALRVLGKDRARFDRVATAMATLGTASPLSPDNMSKIIEQLKAGKQSDHRACATLRVYHKNGQPYLIKDGRFVLIEIDLWAQRSRIEKEVWALVRDLRRSETLSSRSARSLETEYSEEVWQVYDAVKGGKSIYRLARERLQNRFQANADRVANLLPAEDRKLRRFYKKAYSMIRQVYRLK